MLLTEYTFNIPWCTLAALWDAHVNMPEIKGHEGGIASNCENSVKPVTEQICLWQCSANTCSEMVDCGCFKLCLKPRCHSVILWPWTFRLSLWRHVQSLYILHCSTVHYLRRCAYVYMELVYQIPRWLSRRNHSEKETRSTPSMKHHPSSQHTPLSLKTKNGINFTSHLFA